MARPRRQSITYYVVYRDVEIIMDDGMTHPHSGYMSRFTDVWTQPEYSSNAATAIRFSFLTEARLFAEKARRIEHSWGSDRNRIRMLVEKVALTYERVPVRRRKKKCSKRKKQPPGVLRGFEV